MGIFKQQKEADIEVKKIQLQALEDKHAELEPLVTTLSAEISILKEDITRLESKLTE